MQAPQENPSWILPAYSPARPRPVTIPIARPSSAPNHERQRQQGGPEKTIAKSGARNRIGGNTRGIVIGAAGNETWPQVGQKARRPGRRRRGFLGCIWQLSSSSCMLSSIMRVAITRVAIRLLADSGGVDPPVKLIFGRLRSLRYRDYRFGGWNVHGRHRDADAVGGCELGSLFPHSFGAGSG